MITRIETEKAPAAIGPYSQAVRAGKLIFVSGQIPIDPAAGSVVDGGISEQTHQVFRNISAVLQEAGTDLSSAVKTTVFLQDMNDFQTVNSIYAEYMTGEILPARSAVQAARLPKGVRIVDGTGAPAVENGLLVYVSTAEESEEQHGIVYVGKMDEEVLAQATDKDRVIDLKNEYTLTPGLVNTHVHLDLQMPGAGFRLDPLGPAFRALKAYRRAAEALECGVTTLRNVGGGDFFDVAIRKAVDLGMLNGPRVITCGWTLMAHGGHGSEDYGAIECTGPVEFTKEARRLLAKGVDWIKVGMTGGLEGAHEGLCDRQVTNEEIAAVIWPAHAAGKKVCAHLSDDATIRDAVMAGLDSVEHGYAKKTPAG